MNTNTSYETLLGLGMLSKSGRAGCQKVGGNGRKHNKVLPLKTTIVLIFFVNQRTQCVPGTTHFGIKVQEKLQEGWYQKV